MMFLRLAQGWATPATVAVAVHAAAFQLPVDPAATEQPQANKPVRLALPPPPAPAPVRDIAPPVPVPPQPVPQPTVARRSPAPRKRPLARAETKAPVATPEPEPMDPVDDEPIAAPVPAPQEAVAKLAEPVEEVAPTPAPAPPARIDLGAYGRGLHASVVRHRRYPELAQRQELEGVAMVAIRVGADGALAAPPRIVDSTGHAVLDREVIRMVRQAAPFPPLPEGHAAPDAEFHIPVRFRLNR